MSDGVRHKLRDVRDLIEEAREKLLEVVRGDASDDIKKKASCIHSALEIDLHEISRMRDTLKK